MIKEFTYKYAVKFTEESYVSIYKTKIDREKPKYTIKFMIRFLLALILSVFSFFSKYTSFIGICIISFYLYLFFESKLIIIIKRLFFLKTKYLHEEIIYIIKNDFVRIVVESIDVTMTWDLLYTWHKRGDWLILGFNEGPIIYLPITEMKKNNVYESIMILSRKYGKEYK